MRTKRIGFTIVELIVVVVVIAILATIIVLSYAGFKARTQETSVTNDMRNIVEQVGVYKVRNDRYPSAVQLQDMGVWVNKQTYGVNPTGATIFYCVDNNGTAFSIVARVKSSRLLRYASIDGNVITYSGSTTAPQLCLDSGVPGTISTVNFTGFTENGSWYSWVLG